MDNTIEIVYCLKKRGLKHSNGGFMYLKELLEMMVEEQNLHMNLCDYYEVLSQKYKVKPSSVERAIRYSIAKSGLTNKEFAYQIYTEILCRKSSDKRRLQQSNRPLIMDSL